MKNGRNYTLSIWGEVDNAFDFWHKGTQFDSLSPYESLIHKCNQLLLKSALSPRDHVVKKSV